MIAISLVLPVLLAIGHLGRRAVVCRYASLAVAMAGAYWFVERLYFE